MRLRRLDLTRYGKFTDRIIDFGGSDAGEPDFHLIYGPNEAGKSTCLCAFLDLLFGIEARSRFNFLHTYGAMQVGGSLEFGGDAHEFRRVKRPQNSLLDGQDRFVAEHAILGQLGGIDRDSYRAMFSLDDDTLETGGETILASRGDLGELLFSASAGLADLSQTLVTLRAEADGFYRPHARTGSLAVWKAQIATLKDQRAAIDTAAAAYAALVTARDSTLHLYEAAIAERRRIQARIDDVQRQAAAFPRLDALRISRGKIEPLAHLPEAPAQWHENLPALQAEEITISVQLAATEQDIAVQLEQLSAIVVDDIALRLAGRVESWTDARARALTADTDITARHLDVRKEDLAIAGMLGRMGQPDHEHPRDLILPAAIVGALRELIETNSGTQAGLASSARELSETGRLHAEAEAAMQASLAGDAAPQATATQLDAIRAALDAVKAGDHAARRRIALRNHAACADEVTERVSALRPWQGDHAQLASLIVPDQPQLIRWESARKAAETGWERQRGEVARLAGEQNRLEAEVAAISGTAGIVSDQDAAALRALREAAWAGHRRVLDTATADAFEDVLRRDDIVTSARMKHDAQIARLHHITQSLAITTADIAGARAELQKAEARLEKLNAEIAAAIAPLLPAPTTLEQVQAWLAKRERAMESRARLLHAARELHETEANSENARTRLSGAMSAAGMRHAAPTDIETLSSMAHAALSRSAEIAACRARVEERARELKIRQAAHGNAVAAESAWKSAWAETCETCWLRNLGAPPPISAVREMLPIMADLGAALGRRATLLDRIAAMQNDQRIFAAEVACVAAEMNFPAERPPFELDRTITAHVQAARAARDLRAATQRQLEETRASRRGLLQTAEIHRQRKLEMTRFFAVNSLAEVAAVLRDIERRAEWLSQAADAERDMIGALRVPSIEQAEAMLDAADRTDLETELAELKARFEDHDQRARHLFSEHGKAADNVARVGGDAAAAKLDEQRKTILLEIEEAARAYLKLRAGMTAAEHALRAYRQHHRSSMMARASETFRMISRNAYRGLASQPDKDKEVLVAITSDGGSKIAAQLSKGTRFQLYLALRVAGYHEFAAQRDPVPFIADDIMETFDDFRAEEALRLFADMGKAGQVIYLTHHLHLCDIARKVCPVVRVHHLE